MEFYQKVNQIANENGFYELDSSNSIFRRYQIVKNNFYNPKFKLKFGFDNLYKRSIEDLIVGQLQSGKQLTADSLLTYFNKLNDVCIDYFFEGKKIDYPVNFTASDLEEEINQYVVEK